MSDQTLEQKIAAESALLHAMELREKLRTAEARARELEEAMPEAETMRAIARLISPFNSLLTAKAIEEMADRIEKVMKK